MDITRALILCDGAARRSDLLAMGVPERAIARAVRQGLAIRYAPGCYAFPSAPAAVQRAVQFRAQIGCLTACEGGGLPLWDNPVVPHLVVPRERSASKRPREVLSKVELHRSDRASASPLWTPPAMAIDQSAWCTSPLGHLVIIEAALKAGLIEMADLSAMTLGNDRRRTWLTRWASPLSESPLETVARAGFVCAGLDVQQQVEIEGAGRVDMVVEGALVVETDGWTFHAGRDAFETDRGRDGVLLELGLPVLRLTARMLRHDLAGVTRRVAAIVGRRPAPGFDGQLEWLQAPRGGHVVPVTPLPVRKGSSREHHILHWSAARPA